MGVGRSDIFAYVSMSHDKYPLDLGGRHTEVSKCFLEIATQGPAKKVVSRTMLGSFLRGNLRLFLEELSSPLLKPRMTDMQADVF